MKNHQATSPPDGGAGDDGLFPIRTVATVTGVNAVTLRAWERRYGLVCPKRTPKGHRLYTRHDIDLINRIVELLAQGIPISRVPQVLESATQVAEGGTTDGGEVWRRHAERMLDASARFDEPALSAVYNEAMSLYPVGVVTQRLVIPVLERLGERWQREASGVAEEHFFGAFLRSKLGARFHHLGAHGHGPLLLTACLPGERHEIGLMLFSLAAAERGFRLVQLGPDMPLDEVSLAARRADVAAIVLSGSIEPPRALLERELPSLVARARMPVFVGGRTAVDYHDAIRRAGAHPLGIELDVGLRLLEEELTGES